MNLLVWHEPDLIKRTHWFYLVSVPMLIIYATHPVYMVLNYVASTLAASVLIGFTLVGGIILIINWVLLERAAKAPED